MLVNPEQAQVVEAGGPMLRRKTSPNEFPPSAGRSNDVLTKATFFPFEDRDAELAWPFEVRSTISVLVFSTSRRNTSNPGFVSFNARSEALLSKAIDLPSELMTGL